MRKCTTSSFKIPSELEHKMNEKLVIAGYGLRGKSKWITQAIKHFLSEPEEFCMECIEYAEQLQRLDKSVSFRSSQELNDLLDEWIVKVRKKVPVMEGVKSKIIRAAIVQAILRQSI